MNPQPVIAASPPVKALHRGLRPLPVTAALVIGAATLGGSGYAQIKTALDQTGTKVCGAFEQVSDSILVAAIFFLLFVYGVYLTATKQRGGLGWMASGVLGFLIFKNIKAIAGFFITGGCA